MFSYLYTLLVDALQDENMICNNIMRVGRYMKRRLVRLILLVQEILVSHKPKIIGLIRVRNEGHIIQDTLDHMLCYCDHIFLYDDCSTDETAKIAARNSAVTVLSGHRWDDGVRYDEETRNRQALLDCAREQMRLSPWDWFLYMDADERLEWDKDRFMKRRVKADAYRLRLFDFYITDEDKHLDYNHRKWMGPEYRDIIFLFRNRNCVGYSVPDQREAHVVPGSLVKLDGYVKHYGKAISIEHWERKCDYYVKHFPKYALKWAERRGKAVHAQSDQGRRLIRWSERDSADIVKI